MGLLQRTNDKIRVAQASSLWTESFYNQFIKKRWNYSVMLGGDFDTLYAKRQLGYPEWEQDHDE
ncbi:MAG TPA: hypothetical protein PLG59_16725 [bacterium]|nr:hypothetical protein [bacterium]